MNVSPPACDHDIGVRPASGVNIVAAPDSYRHVGKRVNAFGHGLNVELNQFIFPVRNPVDGAVYGVYRPGSMTGVGQFAALRVLDSHRCGWNQIIAAGNLNVQKFIRLMRSAMLIGDKDFALKLDPKAQLKDPKDYAIVGTSVARLDIPAKVTGRFTYMQDLKREGMVHARVVRPKAIKASLQSVNDWECHKIPGYVGMVRVAA